MKRILIFCFLLAFGYAQTADESMSSLSASSQDSSSDSSDTNIVGGYSDQFWSVPTNGASDSSVPKSFYLITPSPTFTFTELSQLFFNNYLNSLMQPTSTATQNPLNPQTSLTAVGVNSLLISTPTNNKITLATAMTHYLPLINANLVYNFEKGKANGPQGQQGGNAQSNVDQSNINVLNIGSLIEPVQFDTDKYNLSSNAKNFISYVSSQFNPEPLINFSDIITQGNLTQAFSNPDVQKYLMLIRQMTANYSTGMNNLYYLYNERTAQKTGDLLGSQFSTIASDTLPQQLQTQASPLALEKWMATYRLTNYTYGDDKKNWVGYMENATPATLQRETLYLLAEIRYELFQQRMLQERLLATTSVAQLQNANSQQITLQQLERSICGNDPLFKNACPQPPQDPSAMTGTQ